MCTLFIDSIRDCFKQNGFARIKENEESGGEFIVGYKGKLYKVYSDLQVSMSEGNYEVCGCGESYALGSLATNISSDSRLNIQKALEVAEKFSGGVRRPFNFIELKKNS